MDHGPKRVILQLNVNKLREANSNTKQITIYESESKEKTLGKQFNYRDDAIWNDLFFNDEN